MKISRYSLVWILCVFILILTGCSGASDLVSPHETVDSEVNPAKQVSEGKFELNRGVFGAWKISVDIENLTAEILPSRNAQAIGHIFDSDLSQFLTVSPCSNCLQIAEISLDQYLFLRMDFRIKHPFADAKTRPDLHGFDVRGIMVLDSPYIVTHDNILITMPDGSQEPSEFPYSMMLNADGYTSHYDHLVTDERYFMGGQDLDGNLNPYLRFFDDTTDIPFDPAAPAGHNVMPVGADFDSRIGVFNFEYLVYNPIEFYFIADVAYGQSATFQNRDNPQYYLPWFNRTEAWRTEYWIENNNLTTTDPTSTADVMVQVFDWQQGVDIDTHYPDPANLVGIPESSDVASVELSLPGFSDSLFIPGNPETGDGSSANPLTYRITVTNENLAAFAHQVGLLAVRDELDGALSPMGRMPVPETPSGFPYETLDIRDYTHYSELVVNIPTNDPTEFNNELDIEKTISGPDAAVLYPTFFMDKGHTKFRYYWDYDYDGVTFDNDGQGAPSPVIPIEPGINYIGLGILTNSVPPREYIYTIPIVGKGEIFESYMTPATDVDECNSFTNGHSVALTEDRQYAVFESVVGGKSAIYLAHNNYSGSFAITKVSNGITNDCFNPSICLIETGPNAGIYVVFQVHSGLNFDLYSTWGNLDGTGFDPGHVSEVIVMNDRSLTNPCLLYWDNKLITYYRQFHNTYGNDIMKAASDNHGGTWYFNGAVATNGDESQLNPSAATNPQNYSVFVTWQDERNAAERGTDIYYAEANDGLSFTQEKNLSFSKTGKVHHKDPEVAINRGYIAVAFTESPDLIPQIPRVQVTFISSYGHIYTHYDPQFGIYEQPHSGPSIASAGNGKFYLAYTTFDNLDTIARIRIDELDPDNIFLGNIESNVYKKTIGGSNFNTYTSPALECIPIIDEGYGTSQGVMVFCTWTDYTDGYSTFIDPMTLQLGNVNSYGTIVDY